MTAWAAWGCRSRCRTVSTMRADRDRPTGCAMAVAIWVRIWMRSARSCPVSAWASWLPGGWCARTSMSICCLFGQRLYSGALPVPARRATPCMLSPR